ncbi:MAG TPA: hypothetical protein DCY94_02710 [Firmicutes bacterium]|nr:hypothetical protein [Bacillota bacterium]
MGDTFNAFVKFISDDPIMLGLCIAIIVLIIAFILVLFLGRKKEDSEECIADNTTELLKTEINMDALKSTQEFSLSELGQDEIPSKDSPVTIASVPKESEPANEEKVEAPAIDIPVTIETEPTALEIPVVPPIENSINTTESNVFDSNIFDINQKEEPVLQPTPLDESKIEPIIESSVNPVEPNEIPSFDSIFGTAQPKTAPTIDTVTETKEEIELPTITAPIPKVETPRMEAPFSSVNVDANAELPSIKPEDFSKTEIIKHIPNIEPDIKIESNDSDEDLDDVDLPMFNTGNQPKNETNKLDVLQGEMFDLR